MIGSDAEAWARLRLVQGRSSAELWELVSARGHTMLTVGSGTGCSWVIQDNGVAPIHFSLHWDGAVLRIADTHGAGNLHVDGAPVPNDWRILTGRSRIDFGAAAIVVETSTGPVSEQGRHPLDRGTLPPPSEEARRTSTNPPTRSDVAAKLNPKATLLGVAPLTGRGAPIMASVPPRPTTPAPPAPGVESGPVPALQIDQTDSFRPKRPSDNARAPKPTLLGMVQPALTPAPPAPAAPTPGSARPGAPASMSQTLLGVGDGLGGYGAAARASRPPGASLADDDQRTIQGFPSASTTQPVITVSVGGSASSAPPGRRETQRGVVSVQPGVVPGAVTQARVRPISDPVLPATPEPVRGQPAQEVSFASPEGVQSHALPQDPGTDGVPQAVLLGGGAPPAYGDGEDRLSDAPTEMRDVASLESRRPRRPFPWRYLGLGALTVVAYVAWLYLLDHV